MKKILVLALVFIAFYSNSVVKRHDVDAGLYELDDTPGYYIDMPFEGAGVLIDKHWILVPAHVIYTFHYDYIDKPLMIHGVENQIKEIIFHPDRKQGDTDWGEGNPKALMDSLNKHTDIALIRLSYPVTHINPIKRYQGESELGQTITVYGKGAVGTGLTGEIRATKRAGSFEKFFSWLKSPFTDLAPTQKYRQLNTYNNIVTAIDDKWIRFRFDKGEEALPLEGTVGSGDSGGPAIILENGKPILVGLASWTEVDRQLKDFVAGKYDSTAVFVRVSSFNDWIEKHISIDSKTAGSGSLIRSFKFITQ